MCEPSIRIDPLCAPAPVCRQRVDGFRPFRAAVRRPAPQGAQLAGFDLDHPQTTQTLAADGGSLKRVLKQAGVTKDSVVRVTGPAGPAAATWLYRHGYEHAAYVPADWVAAKSSADALLIPHACATEELADLLQSGDCLHEDGVLIVQVSSGRFAPGFDSVAAVLRPLGYQVDERISDRGRDIYIARRPKPAGFRQAA